MKDIHQKWRNFLINEAGLAKIKQDMDNYDTAIITAFRGDINDKSMCVYVPPSEEELSERSKEGKRGKTNRRNNKDLSAYLLTQGYGIKNLQGSYIENFGSLDPEKVPREVKENSFFVVNLNDDAEFFEQIINLGKKYCQDSVILIPKAEEAYLYGTNNSYPGLDEKESLGKFMGGETGEFMSRIKKRPFVMKEDEGDLKTYESYSGKQRQAIKLMSKRIQKEIERMKEHLKK